MLFYACYRVCHGFRLAKGNDYFWVDFDTFESSSIFGDSWGSIDNWFKPKTETPSGNLALPKTVKHSVATSVCVCFWMCMRERGEGNR